MSAFTRTLTSWLGTPAPTTRRLARLNLEGMDQRIVPAVVGSPSLSAGTLTVTCNAANDNVDISLKNSKLTVTDKVANKAWTFTPSAVSRVTFNGGDGNDRFALNYSVPLTADGGNGNDYLEGADAADRLDGGANSDTLVGYGGADVLWGQTGNDVLKGMDGKDTLYGGDGEDYLHGGAGDDKFYGGAGDDTFRRSLFIAGAGFSLSGEQPPDREDELADQPVMVTGAFLTEVRTASSRDSQWHIDQAGNPTCSFLAALSAYAERTGASNDLVQAIRYDAASDKYGIRLYVNGQWTTQWVNGDWTENRDAAGRQWVALYEKAYLQAWGVVSRDADGRTLPEAQWHSPRGTGWRNAGNALDALTPGTSRWTAIGSAGHATVRSQVLSTATYGMVAASRASGTTAGVVANHSYMIYDAFTEGGVAKVRLYNPWGHDRQGASTDGKDDGLITLTWAQFTANFTGYYRNS